MAVVYKENALTAADFVGFQQKMGWTADPIEQVEKSIAHQLYSVVAVESGEVVGMGRLLGDAVMYWYINDVFVLTARQGRGIGKKLVLMLLSFVQKSSLPGTSVSVGLMSAKGKEGFYRKLGFTCRPSLQDGAGMTLEMDIPHRECGF